MSSLYRSSHSARRFVLVAMIILVTLVVTACMPGDGRATADKPAGFFWGIWHGWIAPISLIRGLFNNKIRVYEAMNTGRGYDFGFYMAIISGFGGISLFRRRKRD